MSTNVCQNTYTQSNAALIMLLHQLNYNSPATFHSLFVLYVQQQAFNQQSKILFSD